MIKNLKIRPVLYLLCGLGLFLVLLVRLHTRFNYYDEGFAVQGAVRILAGDVPYRDFWAIYPPGEFYLVAGVFKLLGSALVNARLVDTFVRVLLVLGGFLVMRRVTPPLLAGLSSLVMTFLLGATGMYLYAIFPALCLGIWSIWAWIRYTTRGQERWLVLAGVLLGIALFFRWDIGAYAGISVLVPAYLDLRLRSSAAAAGSPRPTSPSSKIQFALRRSVQPLKPLARAYVPLLGIALLLYGAVGIQSGWVKLFEQVFLFPTGALHRVRWLAYPAFFYQGPLPGMDWLRFYLPLLIFLLAFLYLLGVLLARSRKVDPADHILLSLWILGILLFIQVLSRYDMVHATPVSIVTYLVALALFSRNHPLLRRPEIRILGAVLGIFLTGLYLLPALQSQFITLADTPPWKCFSSLPRASCILVNSDQEQAVQFIQDHTRSDEAIFVGNQKHNRIYINDIGFYYLADRPSATRYHELYPGVATTLGVQQEIVSELAGQQVDWLVLFNARDSKEPNDSALDSGVTLLDEYIRQNFSLVAEFGNYRIVARDPRAN